MTSTSESARSAPRPLRLWPGVAAAVFVLVAQFVVPFALPAARLYGMIGAFAGVVAIAIWWLFFSRAAWIDRLGAIAVTIAAFFVIRPLLHPSIVGGMMGNMFAVVLPLAVAPPLVAWAAATRNLRRGTRRAAMVVTILLAGAVWTLLRTDGMSGEGAQIRWRWTPTAEERLLAQGADEPRPQPAEPVTAAVAPTKDAAIAGGSPAPAAAPAPAPSAPAAAPAAEPSATREPTDTPAEWPGFRGPARDGVVHGVRIATDWSSSPPVELWRRPIGPGWSSFAVQGERLYTQEQRGDSEIVAAHALTTGAPLWRHRDATRFWESNAGAGPRGTPTLSHGRVYSLGATGILNALDARTGGLIWSRNAAADTKVKVPMWGFSSSPAIAGDLLVVALSGAVAAYDRATGEPRWSRPSHGGSYSSPQLMTIDGVEQIVFLSGAGATSLNPADGRVLWEHAWPGATIVQPALVPGGGLLISTSDAMGGLGMRRLAVSHDAAAWRVAEQWTSRGLKPYFNDYVVHKGHAYGFDGSILSCIGLDDGERKWKGGRYGQGQLVLLPEQDLLLVLGEEGDLALVSATPDQYRELAKVQAIEGKTWNHPALAGDVLLVRNGEEMAAFRLPAAR